MTQRDLERLSSWLRCYPVVGREDERKALTEIIENELTGTPRGIGVGLDTRRSNNAAVPGQLEVKP